MVPGFGVQYGPEIVLLLFSKINPVGTVPAAALPSHISLQCYDNEEIARATFANMIPRKQYRLDFRDGSATSTMLCSVCEVSCVRGLAHCRGSCVTNALGADWIY